MCIIVVNELVFKCVLYSREGYIGASMVDRMDDLIIYVQISEYFTPPRTPRISGIKSQILKPSFLT